MSSSTQSPPARAKAQTPQLERILDAQRDKLLTIVREHETQIDSLKRSFKESQDALILDVEDALVVSYKDRDEIERRLQKEQQRVVELTQKLDESNINQLTTELASERRSHGATRDALIRSENELEEANGRVAGLEKDLKAAKQGNSDLALRFGELAKANDATNKRKEHLEAELKRSKRESADLEQHVITAKQGNVKLGADLEAATRRAEAAEGELMTFKSRFKQITDFVTTGAPSPDQQPSVVQPMSPAPTQDEQDSVEQRDPRSQTDGTLAQPQSLNPQIGNNVSDKESDLVHCQAVLDQLMDPKNWRSNQYFLTAGNSVLLSIHGAKVGPMNLGTMKEKLAKGSYTSAISFKADFNSMIADVTRLNTRVNRVRIAAEQLLKIFDQAFSSQPESGHKPDKTVPLTPSPQSLTIRKRKADTGSLVYSEDGHTQKRRSFAPLHVQYASPSTGGSLGPVLPSPSPSVDSSQNHEQIDACRVVRKITPGKRLDIEATPSCVAQLVSFEKSPSTLTGDWESLLPEQYWLTSHTKPEDVEKRISNLVHDVSKDVIILRLTPASEADRPEFDRILMYLLSKERFASVSRTGIDKVPHIDLIPASRAAGYPEFFSALNFDLLPPPQTEYVLFMAVVFEVAKDKQRLVRHAWSKRMAAIQKHDPRSLTTMRSALSRNPLHIFKKSRILLTSSEHHMAQLSDLPQSEEIPPLEVRAFGQGVARLSYELCDKDSIPNVGGFIAPKWVFVLGLVVELGKPPGLLVVDVQKKNQPVWLLRRFLELKHPSKRNITLLTTGFPGSFEKWQEDIPDGLPAVNTNDNCLKNTGVALIMLKN